MQEFALSVHEFKDAIGLYWTHVAPSFPFIHRGTFDVDNAPAELLVMMAVTGLARSTHGTRRDDRGLVRRIRARLVEDRFGLEMDLATLQAFTLCHVYDVWHGDTETLFIAQCMWPVVVAHSRKQGIGVAGVHAPDGRGAAAWVAWAKDEERRRAAYSILYIDTQISAFWSQHPSRQLSIFAHNIKLPAPRAQWEAMTPADWLRAREGSDGGNGGSGSGSGAGAGTGAQRRSGGANGSHSHSHNPNGTDSKSSGSNRTGYMPGLHPEFQVSVVTEGYSSAVLAALAGDGTPIRIDLDNSFQVMLVLSGLCAIAWDCRTRGGMGIRFRDGTKHWRTVVRNAVVGLRAAYEHGTAHLPSCTEMRDVRDYLAISIIAILSDIPMLQVAAGASNICGASSESPDAKRSEAASSLVTHTCADTLPTVGPKQFSDGRRRLRLWATTPDAWTCLWQSARYLREALFADWGLYSPWAVFLTTVGTARTWLGVHRSLTPAFFFFSFCFSLLTPPARRVGLRHGRVARGPPAPWSQRQPARVSHGAPGPHLCVAHARGHARHGRRGPGRHCRGQARGGRPRTADR